MDFLDDSRTITVPGLFRKNWIVGFKGKCVKDDILLMPISSKNALLIIILEVHSIPHSGNDHPVWSTQYVRTGCPYSDHRL